MTRLVTSFTVTSRCDRLRRCDGRSSGLAPEVGRRLQHQPVHDCRLLQREPGGHAVCGALGSAPLVSGTLRRGGTRGGTALLLAVAALVGAALAFVPVVGYLEALAVPALGARLRGRAPDRHAGLRSLAKD